MPFTRQSEETEMFNKRLWKAFVKDGIETVIFMYTAIAIALVAFGPLVYVAIQLMRKMA